MRADGSTNFGNGGVMSNPSGDGEVFVWTPRVEGDPFNMISVRSKSGAIKGFKLLEDNPYYSQFKFLSWNEAEGKLSANGVVYSAVAEYEEEKLVDIETVVEGAPIMDEFGYAFAYEEDVVVVYTPEPTGTYSKNSALSGYNKKLSYYDYKGAESSMYDYTYAYYYGYNYGDVYIFGEDDFDSLYEQVEEFFNDEYDWGNDMDWDNYYDSYYAGYDDFDWEGDLDWDMDFDFEEENWDDFDFDFDFDTDYDPAEWEDFDFDMDHDNMEWEDFDPSEWEDMDFDFEMPEIEYQDEFYMEFYPMAEGTNIADYYETYP